ncbi:hypothetical protein BKA56DRAFT_659119 [Ilyonectria sp. MPI-CAGE-AT-0026]|nr:hypothetical protein BKA56DRAFT_659119 [Ilyonectria sp. MPI-CAGE-AT-0026]
MRCLALLSLLALAVSISAETTNTDEPASSTEATKVTQSILILTVGVVPLTTTFTPPATCTEARLSQLASPGYELWVNEPQPVAGNQSTDCYPSQFMKGYTSIANESSSIAPLMSPLVCPKGWHTAKEFTSGYIACCASGYLLAPPSVTSDSNRPAYGGTCYSNFKAGQTTTVTAYDNEDVTGTVEWIAQSSADQAYGHVIDGFALDLLPVSTTMATTMVTTTSKTTTSSETPSETESQAASSGGSSSVPGGTVAGIVVACLVGVPAILFVAFWLRRRRMQRRPQKSIGELDGNPDGGFNGHSITIVAGKAAYYPGATIAHEVPADNDSLKSELHSGVSPLSPESLAQREAAIGSVRGDNRTVHAELDAGWKGYEAQ